MSLERGLAVRVIGNLIPDSLKQFYFRFSFTGDHELIAVW
jgi:hypothetical protein